MYLFMMYLPEISRRKGTQWMLVLWLQLVGCGGDLYHTKDIMTIITEIFEVLIAFRTCYDVVYVIF